jgi:hypothetical protein
MPRLVSPDHGYALIELRPMAGRNWALIGDTDWMRYVFHQMCRYVVRGD